MAIRKTKSLRRKAKKSAHPPPIGIRVSPAMKDALDEVALEWRTTRADVMRELIEHALNTHPRRKR